MRRKTLIKIILIETLIILFSPLLLKITGQVDWGWWVACLPFIIPLIIVLGILVLIFLLNVPYYALEYFVEKMWVRLIKQFGFVYFDRGKLRNQLEQNQESVRTPVAGSIYSIPKEFIISDSSYLLNPIDTENVEVMLVSDNLYDGAIVMQEGREDFLRAKIHSIRKFLDHTVVNYVVRRRILKTCD